MEEGLSARRGELEGECARWKREKKKKRKKERKREKRTRTQGVNVSSDLRKSRCFPKVYYRSHPTKSEDGADCPNWDEGCSWRGRGRGRSCLEALSEVVVWPCLAQSLIHELTSFFFLFFFFLSFPRFSSGATRKLPRTLRPTRLDAYIDIISSARPRIAH